MDNNIIEKLNSQVQKTVLSGKQFGASFLKIKNQLLKGGYLKQKGGKLIKQTRMSRTNKNIFNKVSKKKRLPQLANIKNNRKSKNKKKRVRYSKNKK